MVSQLKQIRRELGLTQGELAEVLGCRKSNISMIETGRSTLTERNKRSLVQFLNVNKEWLDGISKDMFVRQPDTTPCLHGKPVPETIPDSVPLYDMSRLTSLSDLFSRKGEHKPVGSICIPNMPRCDGAVRIVGEGMYPILRTGDIVLYKQISSVDEIIWGDMYLVSIEISGEEYISVRYLLRSERDGEIILSAENPSFGNKEFAISRIKAIALIKASIRLNSMK